MLRRVLLSPSSSRLLGTPSSWGRLQQPVLRQTCKRSLSSAASDDGAVVVAEDMKALEDGVASVPKAVVYYTASWCPPCRAIKPVYASLSTKHSGVKFIKVDVDHNDEAAARANIRSIPAFHFYHNGQVVKKFAGADQAMLSSCIEELEDRP